MKIIFPANYLWRGGSQFCGQSVKHSGHWCVALDSSWGRSWRSSLPTPGFWQQSWRSWHWALLSLDMWLLHDFIMCLLCLHGSVGLDHTSKSHSRQSLQVAKLDKEAQDLFFLKSLHQVLDILGYRFHLEGHVSQDKSGITLPETNSSPRKIGYPKRKLVETSIPTIHLLLVSRRVYVSSLEGCHHTSGRTAIHRPEAPGSWAAWQHSRRIVT